MNTPDSNIPDTAREWHVPISVADVHAIDALHEATGLPRQRIKHAMQCGAVWMTRKERSGRLRRARRALHVGDTVHLYYSPAVLAEQPAAPTLVDDGGVYSVWDKPSGLRSQGSKWGDHCTVVRWAERHLSPERNGFTVHRLDLAASGLILVAHSKKAAAELSRQFRERLVSKQYRAVVTGDCSHLTKPKIIAEPIDGKAATSEVSFAERARDGVNSVVDVVIHTGRKHQIRRHLADLGFPIVGDRLYGGAQGHDPDLKLRAMRLGFQHPETAQRVTYEVAPKDCS